MTTRRKVGLLGGTFDPVHRGHIQMALEAKAALDLDELRLIPCHVPYHREQAPKLNSQQRLHLLKLAVSDVEGLVVDDRELVREGPTYTVDTLTELREALGEQCSLVLLMGVDAYQGFAQWHRWQDIEALAHIGVMTRPGFALDADDKLTPCVDAKHLIEQQPAGQKCLLALTPMPVSATEIRAELTQGRMPKLLATPVANFIRKNRLYGYREISIENPRMTDEINNTAINAIEDLKGMDIVTLDVTSLSDVMDTMIIASGNSNRHVKAIAGNVVDDLKQEGIRPIGVEGLEAADWVLVDLGATVVHVMLEQTRAFYELEKLWTAQ